MATVMVSHRVETHPPIRTILARSIRRAIPVISVTVPAALLLWVAVTAADPSMAIGVVAQGCGWG